MKIAFVTTRLLFVGFPSSSKLAQILIPNICGNLHQFEATHPHVSRPLFPQTSRLMTYVTFCDATGL